MAFVIDGPYKLRLKDFREATSGIHVCYVDKNESLARLRNERVGTRAGGDYVFAVRRRKGAGTPWYVGLNEGTSQSSLHREALTNDKLRKHARALAEEEAGSALLYFLSPEDRRSDSISLLDTFLIWVGRQRNPRLLNREKVCLTPKTLKTHLRRHRIAGVLNRDGSGRRPKGASNFRATIGWNRSMHVGTLGSSSG